jgi:hypothetical protein
MDCEKFDQHVIDALYDELDELTMASMKRHMESCSRCANAFSALRATREVAVLPLEEPSDALESRILFAASAAQRKTPWHKKALRGLAWAGSHAMRPQLAMAAVFVLVIGSSLLLLRAKPGTNAIGPVKVTERGEPSPDRDEGARTLSAPAAAATAAAAAEAAPGQGAAADPPPQARADKEEKQQDEAKSAKGGDAQTALASAKASENASGCDAALTKYDEVGVRFAGTPQAAEAMWSAANCYKKLGDAAKARELYSALAKRDEYKDKAKEALNESAPQTANALASAAPAPTATASPAAAANQAAAGGAKAGAVAGPVAAPPKAPAAKPPSANAVDQSVDKQAPGWGGSRANAAPQKRTTDVSSGF